MKSTILIIALTSIMFAKSLSIAQAKPASQPTSQPIPKYHSYILLDQKKVRVYWDDGDTFHVQEGMHRGASARLQGFNTLESYGPVHRWGKWTPKGLKQIADQATKAARLGTWHCQTKGKKDRYQRILVSCPDLAIHLIKRGLAHIFSLQKDTKSKRTPLQKIQKKAQEQGKGMWKKGVPRYILTSIHSLHEGRPFPYNRLISSRTGRTTKQLHQKNYKNCQWVCFRQSCLMYVSYKQRYGNQKATCLK